MSAESEELAVVLHACSIGRADITSKAIASLKQSHSPDEVARMLSAIRNENNETLLHMSAKRGYADVIRLLLSAGVDPTQRIDRQKAFDVATDVAKKTFSSYLFERIAMDDNNQVTSLLRAGVHADQNAILQWACSFGHINIVKTLLIFGADVDSVDAEGNTALHIATKNGFIELVEILLHENCKRDIKNHKNQLAKDLIPEGHKELHSLFSQTISPKMTYTQLALAKVHEISELEREEDAAEESYLRQSLIDAGFIDEEEEGKAVQEKEDRAEEPAGGTLLEEADDEESSRELLLWPIPKQYGLPRAPPLVLRCSEPLFVCVESKSADIAPMLASTGLLALFSRLNVRVELQRSAASSKIHLAVDASLCPGQHRYQIHITSTLALILASDPTGLMYGLYTFVQYLQLYGELRDLEASSEILIPAIELNDWPDVLNRAVLWSYRDSCLTAPASLRSMVEIFSRLRINRLLLLLSDETNNGDQVQCLVLN